MKLFEPFKQKKPKPHGERLAELEEAKVKLATERAALENQLAQREEQRERMLANDEQESKIVGLEQKFDELHVRIEKLDAQLRFIDAEVLKATEAQTRERWLSVNERRLAAAREYAEALSAAQEAYISFSQSRQEALDPEFSTVYHGFGTVPVPPTPPALELFKQQIEAIADFENGRKATTVQS